MSVLGAVALGLGAAAGAANIGIAGANAGLTNKQFKENLDFQKEQWEYNKNLQQTMFNREDSSVQRRTADLHKAGLSATLAAGGSASVGPTVSTSAPQGQRAQIEQVNLAHAMEAMRMKQDIARTDADIARTKQEIQLRNESAKWRRSRGLAPDDTLQGKTGELLRATGVVQQAANIVSGKLKARDPATVKRAQSGNYSSGANNSYMNLHATDPKRSVK